MTLVQEIKISREILSFHLKGEVSIVTPFDTTYLPEISQRSAIIIASHIAFKFKDLKFLRKYVASNLHKAILCSNMESKILLDSFKTEICSKYYIHCDHSDSYNWVSDNNNNVEGSFELGITEEGKRDYIFKFDDDIFEEPKLVTKTFLVIIKYSVGLSVRVHPKSSIGYSITPEPCLVWTRILSCIPNDIEEHDFSPAIVDTSVKSVIKNHPLVYFK